MNFTAEAQSTQSFLCVLCVSAVIFLSWGCGVPGEPLPPLLDIPQAAELQAVYRAGRSLVSWTQPALTTEGTAIRPDRLGPAEVYRAVVDGLRPDVSVAEFESAAKRVASLPAGARDFNEALTDFGNTAAYAVRLTNHRGESAGWSNIVAVAVLPAPAAPARLAIQPTELGVVLEWPAASDADAYHVYRGEGDGALAFLARTGEPRFSDTNAQFDGQYRYMVRAVNDEGPFRVESADSPTMAVRTDDVFAPPPPTNIVAVQTGTPPVVELSWDPNPAADLAGYNLYRTENDGAPRRLSSELLISPTFRDDTVRAGVTYTYTATAMDRKGNESARSETATIRVELQ